MKTKFYFLLIAMLFTGQMQAQWIHWGNAQYQNFQSNPWDNIELDLALRFEPADIAQYEGKSLTKMKFHPGPLANTANYILKIWEGEPGQDPVLQYTQSVSTPVFGEWNEYELDVPWAVDVTKELWFGVSVNQYGNVGYDSQPPEPDKGNKYGNGEEWFNWGDGNWMIQAYMEDADNDDDNNIYTLTLLANPEEAAITIGAGDYEAGQSIFIQIIVNEGYQFVNWDKDGEHYTWFMNFSYTMPAADVTMTANLNAVYPLELLVNPEGAGVVSGAGNYAEGANVSISAVANPGFDFVNWTDVNDAVVSDIPDFTYTMQAIPTVFTANFEEAEAVVISEFPWLEDFELPAFPPEGWAVANIEGDEAWVRNFAPGGGNSAFHVYGYWQEDTWLITPALELAEGKEYELSFRSYNEYADWYPGAGANSVFVSTGSPSPDSGDFEMIWTPASVIEAWEETFIDLSEYAGQTIYIAFRYYAEYTHSWHVDDVLVTEGEEATENFTITFEPVDSEGNSIDDAVITFNGIENEPGNYVFENIEEGVYEYVVMAFCYIAEVDEVTVNEDMVITVVLGNMAGDANGDGEINILDVIAVSNFWGTSSQPDNWCFINADINSDGVINILDIIGISNIFSGKLVVPSK